MSVTCVTCSCAQRRYGMADNAVKDAIKKGTWVCLKNVHLAPSWLSKLEKALHLTVGGEALQRQRQTKTDGDRDRQTDRQTDRQRHTDTQTDRERD